MAETRPTILRTGRAIALAVTAALPLVCSPGHEMPFSLPKIFLLIYWIGVGALFVQFSRPRRQDPLSASARWLSILALSWIVWFSLSAFFGDFASALYLLMQMLPVVCFFIFVSLSPPVRQTAFALVVPGAIMAAIALAQRLGADPFRLFGWAPALAEGASDRLRVYATLGNPDFVAAYLCGIAPLWWSMSPGPWAENRTGARRVFWLATGLLLALGILATGSRIPLLAGAAFVAWRVLTSRRRVWALAPLAAFLALVVFLSPARSLGETVEGRLYVWRVALPHCLEAPWFGFGPGSFEPKYAQWETDWLKTVPVSDPRLRFAGFQDHAHNDYLEILVEHGVPGLAVFLTIAALGLGGAFLSKADQAAPGRLALAQGAAGGLVALLACAVADFPFHRPAALFLFWMLLAMIYLCSFSCSSGARGADGVETKSPARAAKEEPV